MPLPIAIMLRTMCEPRASRASYGTGVIMILVRISLSRQMQTEPNRVMTDLARLHRVKFHSIIKLMPQCR